MMADTLKQRKQRDNFRNAIAERKGPGMFGQGVARTEPPLQEKASAAAEAIGEAVPNASEAEEQLKRLVELHRMGKAISVETIKAEFGLRGETHAQWLWNRLQKGDHPLTKLTPKGGTSAARTEPPLHQGNGETILDKTMRLAVEASGVGTAEAFRKLPKEEQNAFLAQASGSQRPEAVAAAAAAGKGEGYQLIPVAKIAPSATNRHEFDAEKLAELVDSVKAHGVMQPIVVRPRKVGGDMENRAEWEIVMGERRWRAACSVGHFTIPCRVRELSDREAMEWQLTENLLREDLRPMDEARGYQQMQGLGYSVDQIAEKLKIGRSTIFARLKLLDLPMEAKEAVETGKLPASHAELLTRVHDPKQQKKLAAKLLEPREVWRNGHKEEEAVSFRDAKEMVSEVTTALEKEEKWQAQAEKEFGAKGYKILSLAESEKAIKWGSITGSYVGVSDKCELDPEGHTWKQLVGDQVETIVARNSNSQGRLLYLRKAAMKVLKEAEHEWANAKPENKGLSEKLAREVATKKAQEKADRERLAHCEVVAKIVAAAEARELTAEVLRLLARKHLHDCSAIVKRREVATVGSGYDKERKGMEAYIQKSDGKRLRGLLVELLLWDWQRPAPAQETAELAKALGVKVQASGLKKGPKI